MVEKGLGRFCFVMKARARLCVVHHLFFLFQEACPPPRQRQHNSFMSAAPFLALLTALLLVFWHRCVASLLPPQNAE